MSRCATGCLRTADTQVCYSVQGGTTSDWSQAGTGTTATTTTTSSDASLSALALAESGGDAISLNPGFATGTTTYLASVANGIDTVTLTATKNDSNATVVIASDDDTGTKGVAELDLNVGSNTLTVTVMAEDGTTEQEYTITVTRAGATTADVVWSTTMTVGETTGDSLGFSATTSQPGGSLDRDFFTVAGSPYTVLKLDVGAYEGGLLFKTVPQLSSHASYTLEFAGETLPLSDTTTRSGGMLFDFTWLAANAPSLSETQFRTTLAVDAMVSVCLRTATQICPRGTTTTNTAATGQPGISGTAQVGQTLTATTSGISDADGKTKAEDGDTGYAYTHQWILVDGNTETDISGETSSTYTLSSSDVGKTIRVRVSFTDDLDNAEGPLTSEKTAAVAAGNTAATGKPSITGTAEVGRTLTASTSGISDANGKTKAENGDAGYAYTYQWVRVDGTNETDIAGATSDTYRLVQADAGKTFRVKVSFKDNAGNSEGPLTSNEYPVSGAYGDLRLVDDSGPTDDGEGRLEVFFRGEWGTVCDDRFASETFKVYAPLPSTPPPYETRDFDIVRNVAPQLACQLMGHSTGEVVSRGDLGMSVAPASQEIWLDDVRCAEGSTPPKGLHQQCYHAGVGLENCTHEEDVHLRCFGSSTARAAFSGEFQNVPESHDGTEFTFQAAFSEAVTASAEDLRDHAFDVTGGTVTEVSPVDGRRDLWSVTVSPASSEDVTITLDGERACDTPGAVCAEDGEQLTNTVSVEIPGTPVIGDGITARFEDVPPQHDGETPFTLRLALSAPVRNSYTAMRENVLEATGGTVTRARRIDGRSDLWEITITPQGEGNVQLVLAAGRACGTLGALCTRDGRALATGLMTLVPGPSTIGPRSPGPAPLTARFTNIPGEHDGESAFTLEIVFSEAPSGMKNKTLRNALRVTNGAVTRVRRVNHVSAHRIVTVQPTGHEAVDIELPASQDCEAAGAICTGAGGRLEAGLLTRVRGPAALRVADAEVHEGPGAVLAFAVTLDRAASAAVRVDYATSDGTAQAGSDYTAATGSVTFAPGETAKTVSVAVLDDSHDEGTETLTLTLTNPSGAYLADAVATGTIENTDAMPRAWMVRFGRTVGTQVVDALTQRLDGAGGSHVTVAGINLIGAKGEEPTLTDDDPFGLPEWAKNAEREADAQSITGEDLVLRSAFHLSSGGNAMQQGGGAFTTWGRVASRGSRPKRTT